MKKNLIEIFIFINIIICYPTFIYGQYQYKTIKEDNFIIHYPYNFNSYTLEYIIKLIKIDQSSFSNDFKITNKIKTEVYLYNDTVTFIQKENVRWWQNYIIKSNGFAVNNIDLLMQNNKLNLILKYLFYKFYLLKTYKNRIPAWFLNGLALYWSKLKFSNTATVNFNNFQEVIDKLKNYSFQYEYYGSNMVCLKMINYLYDNYNHYDILQLLKNSNNYKEFKVNFFNIFGISYQEFLLLYPTLH